MRVAPFEPAFEAGVVDLIVGIQRGEFAIPITADEQPDLRRIPEYYQSGSGGFWVALDGGRVVGTVALFDIGGAAHRGAERGVAKALLETLLAWARARGVREIFLGTTSRFLAAHRFYEKNGFEEIVKSDLPASFPVMAVDVKFYRLVPS
jgi:N-acetylglutamate synthase-like GNAT family acetyltransferase